MATLQRSAAPEGRTLAPVVRTPGRRKVQAVVDSGAWDSVIPPGDLTKELKDKVQPSTMSKAGATYSGANGARIANLGQVSTLFEDSANQRHGLHFQVADVTQALISVAGLVDAGNRVSFEPGGAHIHHLASGRKINIAREGNAYLLDMMIEDADAAPGFTRPEKP